MTPLYLLTFHNWSICLIFCLAAFSYATEMVQLVRVRDYTIMATVVSSSQGGKAPTDHLGFFFFRLVVIVYFLD